MADKNDVLARLRDPNDGGLAARLAKLLVDDALGRTLRELIDPAPLSAAIVDGVRAITASDEVEKRIARALEEAAEDLAARPGPLGAAVPPALQVGLRELAQLRAEAPREVVLKLLDREPLRVVLRAQVVDTLIAFGRKAASPVADSPIARGIGGLGKLALGQIASNKGALGSLANAVSSEVERQIEKRASDFADTAIAGILEGVASQVGDPAKNAEQAAVWLALLDGLLELTGADVAVLARSSLLARVAVVRKAALAWSRSATFASDIDSAIAAALAREGDRTLRELLGELGVADTVARHAVAFVRKRIDGVVSTEAFDAWLADLLGA